ncbi:flagellar basal body P-ring biosynthesis protein FlgA [bacterium BMS3Abin04]|nr:flagellar basal body P-ring biosynthesis protein FlgA [bacterium BMS3Abin04]
MLHSVLLILTIIFTGFRGDGKIDNYLKSRLSSYKHFTYEIISFPKGHKFGKNSGYSIAKDKKFRVDGKFGYIPIYLTKNRKGKTLSFISLKLSLFKDVWVSNRNIKTGQEISGSDFNLEEKDVTKIRSFPIEDIGKIQGYKAKRNIRKGTILSEDMLKRIAVVKSGTSLTAIKIAGNVKISFSVYARSSGNVGDVIRVTYNKRVFKAKVINSNYVQIIE